MQDEEIKLMPWKAEIVADWSRALVLKETGRENRMKSMRPQFTEMASLGPFPSSDEADQKALEQQERLMREIVPPISEEEAEALLKLFGPDDYYGLAWTVLHLIETTPGWPIWRLLEGQQNEWIARLRSRATTV